MSQMLALRTWVANLIGNDEGQTLAEYALILALIAVGVIGAVLLLQGSISNLFSNVGSQI